MLFSVLERIWKSSIIRAYQEEVGYSCPSSVLRVICPGNWLLVVLCSRHFLYEKIIVIGPNWQVVFWCKQWANWQINKCWARHASPQIILTYCKNNGKTKWKCVMLYLSYGHGNREGNRLTQIRLAAKEASRTTLRKSICKRLHEINFLRNNQRTLLRKIPATLTHNRGASWARNTFLF